MSSNPKTVINYYVLCTKLKSVIRKGWKNWNVNRERLESVAEHIFGTQQLAIAMWSQYPESYKNLDISKVIIMLAVHELEEIFIGDLTQWDISKEEKIHRGHAAVHHILEGLLGGTLIESLIHEFDTGETPEAKFAYSCDKLECDIQSKLYDEEGCVDLTQQDDNPIFQEDNIQQLLNKKTSWSAMWLEFGRQKYRYDKNFTEVSKYAEANDISV